VTKSAALVLFDIDGTLMRGAGGHHKHALIEGIRVVTNLTTHLDGVPTAGALDRDLILAMLRAAGYSQRRAQSALRPVMAACQNVYASVCKADLSPFLCNGVAEFIGQVKARGAVLGLVTGNLREIGWRKIELAGLRNYFDIGAFAEDGKTRARLAQIAAQRAKRRNLVARGCRVTLIGDHMNDIEAAKRNGFQSVAVATGVTPFEALQVASPDYLVRNLSELSVETVL